MKKTCLILAMALLAVGAFAADIRGRVLGVEEMAAKRANYCFEVKYSDFAETSTNTAETLTFAVSAKESVRFVSMELATAFDTADTNYTGSLAVTVGDGTDADLFLTSTELASDGTEVFFKYDAGYSSTMTLTTEELITEVGSAADNTDLQTNTVVTAASFAPGALGRKVYTAADTIDFTFTPNTEEATSENTSGLVRFYLIVE